MDDKSLVEAVRGGRTELFADLVDRHASAVFRLVRAAIRNDSDVEDIAQDTFLASYKSLDRLRDPRRFRSHLLAIAARKVVDHLRKKKVRSGQVQMTDDPPLPDMSEVRSLVAAVEEVVARLDADARLIFALRHHGEKRTVAHDQRSRRADELTLLVTDVGRQHAGLVDVEVVDNHRLAAEREVHRVWQPANREASSAASTSPRNSPKPPTTSSLPASSPTRPTSMRTRRPRAPRSGPNSSTMNSSPTPSWRA